MIVQCPSCYSDNVTNLSADSNDFICNDCGEDFQADNGIDIDADDEGEGFVDLDPQTAIRIANLIKKHDENADDSPAD